MKKLTLFLITILALNLACDEDNNKSENGDNKSNGTKDPTTTTIPIPENLSSDEDSSTDGAYKLSWSEVDGATTYKLQEGQEGNAESYTESYSGEANSHPVTGKDTGSYSYQVRACDANDICSDWSSAIIVHVFTSGAPMNLRTDEIHSIDGIYILMWNMVDGAATYELQENDIPLSPSGALTHRVTGNGNGSYSYHVRACHANGVCSGWSSPAVTVQVFTSDPPTLMSNPTTSTDGNYTLSWNEVDGAVTYKLRKDGVELRLSSDDLQNRTYRVRNERNGSYRYEIRACPANGVCGDWSSVITVHVFISSTPTLRSDKTSSTDGTYALDWDSVSGATTYELQENGDGLTLSPDDAIAHNISGQPDGDYTYRVRACHRSGGCSLWSNHVEVSVSITCADTSADETTGFNYGTGSSANPYLICTYPQLKKMRENNAALTKHYKLGAHIDASGSRSEGTRRSGTETCTAYDSTVSVSTTAGHPDHDHTCTGWAPVGDSSNAFTGGLEGANYEIRNLYISIKTGANRGGLFGQTGSASLIQNLGVTDAYIQVDVTGFHVGSLVGYNEGSISNSHATGSVTASAGGAFAGGLVGSNVAGGRISKSYATGSVTVSDTSSRVGGLVGWNDQGSISNSHATGQVSSTNEDTHIGGLVGENDNGSISNSYATGQASGGSNLGGLVGWNNTGGRINNSYATGRVSGGSNSISGGLVGSNGGSISNSYATGRVSGSVSAPAGGLVAYNNATGRISKSYATGQVDGGLLSIVGGLVGNNLGSLSNSYASGLVTGSVTDTDVRSIAVGGLVGQNTGSISNKNYFVNVPAMDDTNADGIGRGGDFCGTSSTNSPSVCIRAGTATTMDDDQRRTWLQDTLDERTANDANPVGLEWSETNWGNFVGSGVGYPKLKYAEVTGYCSHTGIRNERDCVAGGSCRDYTGGTAPTNSSACRMASGTWVRNSWWLAGEDECGGSSGVVCGAMIPGQ